MLSELTHPTLEAYAERVNADFKVIREKKFDAHPSWQKLQIADYLTDYDRVFYVDTDAIISPLAPNIFEEVPRNCFGAFSEGMYLDRIPQLTKGIEQFGIVPPLQWHSYYFNAGVFVCSQFHIPVFKHPKVYHDNMYDQTYLNLQVGTKYLGLFTALDVKWNRMQSIKWEKRHESYIIHYAGGTAHRSPEMIREDLRVWSRI